jgi:hypothetical protein
MNNNIQKRILKVASDLKKTDNTNYKFIKVPNDVDLSFLYESIKEAYRASKKGNLKGAAEAFYNIDEVLGELQRDITELSQLSKDVRKKFVYNGPLFK